METGDMRRNPGGHALQFVKIIAMPVQPVGQIARIAVAHERNDAQIRR